MALSLLFCVGATARVAPTTTIERSPSLFIVGRGALTPPHGGCKRVFGIPVGDSGPAARKNLRNPKLRHSWWRQRAVSGIIKAIKRKGAKPMMTWYLGLMALGAALMALLVTGVWALYR